jgi:hypothetical protein
MDAIMRARAADLLALAADPIELQRASAAVADAAGVMADAMVNAGKSE